MQEKNAALKIPPQGAGRDKYGLGPMRVGEQNFLPFAGLSRASVARAVFMHAKRHRKKFVTRIWTENGIVGLRVWRTK